MGEKPLKVSVTLTIELTQEGIDAWSLEYGIDPKRSAIRDDVKRYVNSTVQGQIMDVLHLPGITVERTYH
jgi:hypothetical protein